jgi:predicted MPP superfamily phosphohydrolase
MNIVNKRKKRITRIIILSIAAAVFVCIAGTTVYGIFIEPTLLEVRHYVYDYESGTVAQTDTLNADETKTTLRFVQLSDLHIGEFTPIDYLAKLTDRVNEYNPDIILFTGDLFSSLSDYALYNQEKIAAELKRMTAGYGKFAVYGNHDTPHLERFRQTMSDGGFLLLENSSVAVKTAHVTVSVGGIADLPEEKDDYLQAEKASGEIRLLMTHRPICAENFTESGYLILAGHTHGGQTGIPIIRDIALSLLGRSGKFPEGFFTLDVDAEGQGEANRLYVNTGIGMSGIPARVGMKPMLAVFDVG